MHRDPDDLPVPLEHRLHVVLRQRERVHIPDEYPGVDHLRITRVGYVADFNHPRAVEAIWGDQPGERDLKQRIHHGSCIIQAHRAAHKTSSK